MWPPLSAGGHSKGWLCRETLLAPQGLKELPSSPAEGTAKPYNQRPWPRQGSHPAPWPRAAWRTTPTRWRPALCPSPLSLPCLPTPRPPTAPPLPRTQVRRASGHVQAQAILLIVSLKPTRILLSPFSLCFLGPSYLGYEAAVHSAAGPHCPPLPPLPFPEPPGSLWGGSGSSPSASSAGSFSGKLLAPPKLPKPKGGPREPPLHYCDICKISCAGPQVSCHPPPLSRPRRPSGDRPARCGLGEPPPPPG